ncbi:MAG: hypothetical protein M3342_02330 [Bacteroidota bacterium]|nr:hypothetical protein [Flavisolibacter sp.]MBD0375907.1 hypothetical protein [Flavisolibacter sp.]MDQ3842841.1 hypothetical protein [Bacteroidota bacterium]
MKKMIVSVLSILVLVSFSVSGNAQKKSTAQAKTVAQKTSVASKNAAAAKTMTWTTKSEAARALALEGANHMMNIEMPQAYRALTEALKLDSDFTVALVFMSYLSTGEAKKAYAQRALKSADNKTAGEKLFASLVAEDATPEKNREIWAKLHDMFPDGRMIGHYYAVTRATPEERFSAVQDYIRQFPDQASMYNIIAYYYLQDKKDNENAKRNFEKYIELYPDGINPYDSMGEFYLLTGDLENAEKYYKKALEKYPFNSSSQEALKKIEEAKKKTSSN